MGRKLVILLFLASTAVAVWVFLTREVRSLRENLGAKGEREALAVLEDFLLTRYEGSRKVGFLGAKLGSFYEPNLASFDGEVKAERVRGHGLEAVSAESATVVLDVSGLTNLMQTKVNIASAELTGFVEVATNDHVLLTDSAKFDGAKQVVHSNRSVRVEGPNRVFTGEDGFEFALDTETLRLPGRTKGVVALDKD